MFSKKFLSISLLLLLLVGIFGTLSAECAKESGKLVTITELNGNAGVSFDKKKWSPLKKNETVTEKQFIKTEKGGSLVLTFPDGTAMKVGEATLINMEDIVSSAECEREEYSIKVFFGKVWSKVKKIAGSEKNGGYKVHSKNAVAGVRGTSFGFIVNPDESGAVMVLTGAVAVSSIMEEKKDEPLDIQKFKNNRSKVEIAAPKEITKEEWEHIVVKAMQYVKFDSSGKIAKPVPIGTHNADEWFKANMK